MKRVIFLITQVIFTILLLNCGNQQGSDSTENKQKVLQEPTIEQRSYNLGVIGAFAEVVDIGIKKLALSSPLTPEEMDALIVDAQRIVKDNHY